MTNTATAHVAWNQIWSSPDSRAAWETPAPDVATYAVTLRQSLGMRRVLDLGCGVGRHALMFARAGFQVAATDMAESGIDELRRKAAEEELMIDARVATMMELPFADASFDYVLAFNVIYHGDPRIVGNAVSEIRRVLRPGGVYQGTMLSKRNRLYNVGTEIAPNTFVNDDDRGDDKSHPHFYCDAAELVVLFSGFELLSLTDEDHSKAGSWHWHLVAERLL
ncbi:class I SAM-dependent methyltransferase [Bosea eneae]|uniref:Class I SAM-dependent methyltransferase n=1 Tax=Bosea eneae TaxID=151454 RepID=A0ABW0IZM2_9HYPH